MQRVGETIDRFLPEKVKAFAYLDPTSNSPKKIAKRCDSHPKGRSHSIGRCSLLRLTAPDNYTCKMFDNRSQCIPGNRQTFVFDFTKILNISGHIIKLTVLRHYISDPTRSIFVSPYAQLLYELNFYTIKNIFEEHMDAYNSTSSHTFE